MKVHIELDWSSDDLQSEQVINVYLLRLASIMAGYTADVSLRHNVLRADSIGYTEVNKKLQFLPSEFRLSVHLTNSETQAYGKKKYRSCPTQGPSSISLFAKDNIFAQGGWF